MITEDALLNLRSKVKALLSAQRFNHVLGVEEAAATLGRYCLPNEIGELRAAALLHDITKEISLQKHIDILKMNSVSVEDRVLENPHLLHSFSAPYVIAENYPQFATPEILSAVEKHTLGADNMSIFDEIIFISDYIELGREYSSCIAVREFLYSHLKNGDFQSNLLALHKACIMSIDFTVKSLEDKNRFVHPRMLDAKKFLNSYL